MLLLFIALSIFMSTTVNAQDPVDLETSHKALITEMHQLHNRLIQLPTEPPEKQEATQNAILNFLDNKLLPIYAWDEKNFYPYVDKCMECPKAPFTVMFQREHSIVRRRINELKFQKNDITEFAITTHEIFGLVDAYFEVEDTILIPLSKQCEAEMPPLPGMGTKK